MHTKHPLVPSPEREAFTSLDALKAEHLRLMHLARCECEVAVAEAEWRTARKLSVIFGALFLAVFAIFLFS